MKRRRWLKVTSLAGLVGASATTLPRIMAEEAEHQPADGANAAPAPAAQAAFNQGAFRIGVQMWSLKEYPLFEALGLAAGAGTEVVEFFAGHKLGGEWGDATFGPGMAPDALAAVEARLEELHLKAMNLGVIEIPPDEAAARQIFEFASRLGCYGVTTESLEQIDLIEKLAREFNLKACFHNHPKPTALWNPQIISEAIEGRDERLGFCADIGHWATSGLDPLEVIQKIAPRVHAFHMKDRATIGQWSAEIPFGTGIIDLTAILDEVGKHNFAGNVSIEYEANWQSNQAEIAQCVGYLRGYRSARSARS